MLTLELAVRVGVELGSQVERWMAKASSTKRRRKTLRVVREKPRIAANVRNDISRRLQDEIIRNPIKWALIALGIGYIYGRFKR